jgi:4-alpha-glucanotransferase
MTPRTRRAGILVPLFSIPSTTSWGIGEIGDIERMCRWLEDAGQRVLQLLPINEMPPGETSPYSALSAMALDPQFISLALLEDFAAIGGEAALEPEQRARLDAARAAPAIDYATVRELKRAVLGRCFVHFRQTEWAGGTHRASAFRVFLAEQAWWLEDYALFRALHARHGDCAWMNWPQPLRDREPSAIDAARRELADDILFRQYMQWVAGTQWGVARDRAGSISLFGDLPFMVAGDSADVWARQEEFRLDATVGVPADAFSETGQDWGLPVYRWDRIATQDFEWLRTRARRNADLFGGYRIDHLVGFYRTYFREQRTGAAGFVPEDEPSQLALGERVLSVLREAGAEITAEDLGTVPDFVRESLARQSIPGYKVLRWERRWNAEGQPFTDPGDYPAVAVATSGTHDTEPLAVWWEQSSREERKAVLEVPSIRSGLTDGDRDRLIEAPGFPRDMRDALLEALYASNADLVVLPLQDVFGWRDRINQPATVGNENWTWRLPWPSDRLATEPEAIAQANQLREWARRHNR